MSLFQRLFVKKSPVIALRSPLAGTLKPASAIPDPTFADGILGPAIAIEPAEGLIRAPAAGRIEQIFRTAHAVTMSCGSIEILIHVGINTVELKGRGFSALIKDGDMVAAGTPLIRFELDTITAAGLSPIVPMAIIEAAGGIVEFAAPGEVTAESVICTITPQD